MLSKLNLIIVIFFVSAFLLFGSCKEKKHPRVVIVKKEIVKKPEEIDDQITGNIKNELAFAVENNNKIDDSITLNMRKVDSAFYEKNNYHNIWSKKETWQPWADSMFDFIKNCKYYGLYPSDYHFKELDTLRKKVAGDTLAHKDAVVWTKADLMFTDAFMKTAKDLKEGRLVPDSVSIAFKPKYIDSFFLKNMDDIKYLSLTDFFNSIEPKSQRYQSLKMYAKEFIDTMHTKKFQHIDYPEDDTMKFISQLQTRLAQEGIKTNDDPLPDSLTLSDEIKEYEAMHKFKKDGKLNDRLIERLNNTDEERFKRIAITLDRCKMLPDSMPQKYIWVNIPGYYLQLWDNDSVIINSKVIVGKPKTPTPTLFSRISDMVTYPQWTIPESIIKKEILPGLKKDPTYLQRKGYNLIDSKGQVVDATKIKWSRYKDAIPWKIMQGSGDDNALGVFKFNFYNPYSVYLHDTNERYLFKNTKRALSHGCVRVQAWQELEHFITANDSLNNTSGRPLSYNTDSINTWLANKQKKTIYVKNRLPLFIQYFTCDVKNNKLVFYDDIYNNDAALAEKYFANK